jgi:hypothetical protein
MDLSVTIEHGHQDDQSWLASQHGTDATRSITLDMTTFIEGTHYPDGYLPSGIALGKITASGKYGPYDDTAVDGREYCFGFLFTAVKAPPVNTTPTGGAILLHGFVISGRLPIWPDGTPGSLDSAAITDLAGRVFAV